MDISTPGSPNYGNHMAAEEVIDFFAPHPSTVDAVTEWLVSSGISLDRFAISRNKQVIESFPDPKNIRNGPLCHKC